MNEQIKKDRELLEVFANTYGFQFIIALGYSLEKITIGDLLEAQKRVTQYEERQRADRASSVGPSNSSYS